MVGGSSESFGKLEYNEHYRRTSMNYENVLACLEYATSYSEFGGTTVNGSLETIEILLRLIGNTVTEGYDYPIEGCKTILYTEEAPTIHCLVNNMTEAVIEYVYPGYKEGSEKVTLASYGGEVPGEGLIGYLCRLELTEDMEEVYPVTYHLSNRIKSLFDYDPNHNTEDSMQQAIISNEAYDHLTVDEIKKLPLVEQWMYSVRCYITQTDNRLHDLDEDIPDSDYYPGDLNFLDLSKYEELAVYYAPSIVGHNNETDMMSYEEYLRVKAYIYVALKHLVSDNLPAFISGMDPYSNINDVKIANATGGSGLSKETVRSKAEQAATSYSRKAKADITIRGLAKKVDDLVYYVAARMYGFGMTDITEEDETVGSNAELVTYCEYLESLIPDVDKASEEFIVGFSENLPRMKNMTFIAGTRESYKAYLTLNYIYMLMNKYADEYAGLKVDEDGTYYSPVIEELMEE